MITFLKITILGIVVTLAGHILAADPKMLLTPVAIESVELTEKQAKILDRIKKAPTTVDWKVVRLHEDALTSSPGTIKMVLTGDKTLELKGYTVVHDNETTRLKWKGSLPGELVNLSVRGGSVTGLVYSEKRVYSLEPLGNGMQVLVHFDQTKARDEP